MIRMILCGRRGCGCCTSICTTYNIHGYIIHDTYNFIVVYMNTYHVARASNEEVEDFNRR